jgi:hypothetical protein
MIEIRPELIILMVLIVVGIVYMTMFYNKHSFIQPCSNCEDKSSMSVNEQNIYKPHDLHDSRESHYPHESHDSHYHNPHTLPNYPLYAGDPLREFDRRAFSDPLAPPRKRNLHEPDYLNPTLAPIYTQGAPSPYRKVGTLKAVSAIDGSDDTLDTTSQYKWLYLMASKINSNQFNYYVSPTDIRDTIKFELTKKTEIYDGDYVEIATLDNQGYKVVMDANALPLLVGIV